MDPSSEWFNARLSEVEEDVLNLKKLNERRQVDLLNHVIRLHPDKGRQSDLRERVMRCLSGIPGTSHCTAVKHSESLESRKEGVAVSPRILVLLEHNQN